MKIAINAGWLTLLLAVALVISNSQAQLVDSSLPIEMEADATGADARTGKVTFTNISIRQGPLSIVAKSAESSTLGFDDSTWTFSGNVKLTAPGSALSANRMTLRFVNKRIEQAALTGEPLEYTGSADSGTRVIARTANVRFSRNTIASVELAGTPIELSRAASADSKSMEGKANAMTYSATTDNLELTGDAELGEGANRITGNQITYNLSTRQVLAAANELGEGRVHITINPSSDDESASLEITDGQPDVADEEKPQVEKPGEEKPDEEVPPESSEPPSTE